MADLQGLLRTWGPRMEDVLARRAEAADLVSLVDDAAAREQEAQRALAEAEDALAEAARVLDAVRMQAAPRFAEAVCARWTAWKWAAPSWCAPVSPPRAGGVDACGGLCGGVPVPPRRGMQARPLARIASGGEVSRVMLAVKVVLGAVDGVDTLVFDEVDAGVGGSTAVALADVLADLARTHQVIVVTHLAQVAVRGEAHSWCANPRGPPACPKPACSVFPQTRGPPKSPACFPAMPPRRRSPMPGNARAGRARLRGPKGRDRACATRLRPRAPQAAAVPRAIRRRQARRMPEARPR